MTQITEIGRLLSAFPHFKHQPSVIGDRFEDGIIQDAWSWIGDPDPDRENNYMLALYDDERGWVLENWEWDSVFPDVIATAEDGFDGFVEACRNYLQ